MPLGNTKEAIPFKKDSLNHIPTHFVIRLDSKSILKPGPLDSSSPTSSSLNIPAHMNHSNSWLLKGISCPTFSPSLFRSVWLFCWKLGRNSVELWFGPRGRRAQPNPGLWLWDRLQTETWRLGMCWEMPAHPRRDFVLYHSNCNMSSGPYFSGNITPTTKDFPMGGSFSEDLRIHSLWDRCWLF